MTWKKERKAHLFHMFINVESFWKRIFCWKSTSSRTHYFNWLWTSITKPQPQSNELYSECVSFLGAKNFYSICNQCWKFCCRLFLATEVIFPSKGNHYRFITRLALQVQVHQNWWIISILTILSVSSLDKRLDSTYHLGSFLRMLNQIIHLYGWRNHSLLIDTYVVPLLTHMLYDDDVYGEGNNDHDEDRDCDEERGREAVHAPSRRVLTTIVSRPSLLPIHLLFPSFAPLFTPSSISPLCNSSFLPLSLLSW